MPWTDKCYSRLLIDNHISDLKPGFMSRFDPERYVAMVRLAEVESAMVYACDHNGNCYYPTASGHRHRGIGDRDLFGATVAGLRSAGVTPVGYYTVVYHNHAAASWPEARIRGPHGQSRQGRYHWVCPNSPEARRFFRTQLLEVIAYPIAGIFIDMTFWPTVCCCASCREKFRNTANAKIPEIVNWNHPAWLQFQKFREDSLTEFAAELTAVCRAARPDLTVTHQFSPMMHGWRLGQTSGIAMASDYASGDFYGGRRQQRFAVKGFAAESTRPPFEYMTSRCVTLRDHTSTKSEAELFLHALTTLANGGAYLFIDAINPDGTLEESCYRRLRRVGRQLKPFRRMVAAHVPVPAAAVGVYFSLPGCIDPDLDGLRLTELDRFGGNLDEFPNPVRDEAVGLGEALNEIGIPYRVITDRTEDYSGLRAIAVNRPTRLTPAEVDRLDRFVRRGGTLIVTGSAPGLEEMLGIDFTGTVTGPMSYLALAPGEPGAERLISCSCPAPLATARPGTRIRGRVTLPDFPPQDPDRYASIHSDPPGIATDYAGWTQRRHGRGRTIWIYSAILGVRQASQRELARRILKHALPRFSAAPPPAGVELTWLRSTRSRAYLLGVVNYPAELPGVPLTNLTIDIALPQGFQPRQVRRASDRKSPEYTVQSGRFRTVIPRLDTGEIFELS